MQKPKTPSSYFQRHSNWELWAVTNTKLQPQNQVYPLMISKFTFLAIITTLCSQVFLKFYKQQIVKHDLVGTGCAIYLEHMLCFTPDLQRFFLLTGDILVSFHNLIPPNLYYSWLFWQMFILKFFFLVCVCVWCTCVKACSHLWAHVFMCVEDYVDWCWVSSKMAYHLTYWNHVFWELATWLDS